MVNFTSKAEVIEKRCGQCRRLIGREADVNHLSELAAG